MTDAARSILCLDMGTTRTRVWFVHEGNIVARAAEDFGVRNLVTGKAARTKQSLRNLLHAVEQEAWKHNAVHRPECIVAAGMIGALQGLHEVPHIAAPAGARQLADAIVRVELVEITQLPLYIVPGVRQQAADSTDEGICTGDVMRGEESLIVGLVASGRMRARECLLNLGSHWKWIVLDGECQIASSRTSLTGEMIHAVQTHTLLASGLSPERPEVFDMHWLHEGMRQSQREGLFRALLCVRLLELSGRTNSEQRISFLYGAFIQQEISVMRTSAFFSEMPHAKVLIAGSPALSMCWQEQLRELGWDAEAMTAEEVERAYLQGLFHLFANRNDSESQ